MLLSTMRYFASNRMHNSNHKGITHAECAMAIGHTRIGPSLWETLKLVELIRN